MSKLRVIYEYILAHASSKLFLVIAQIKKIAGTFTNIMQVK